MPISRVLLFILVGLIGLAGGQEYTPEEVIRGTTNLALGVIRGVVRGATAPAPTRAGAGVPSRDQLSPQADPVILEIQAGLVELGCLSVLTPDKKLNIDGAWGARTKAGFDQFAKDILDGDADAEDELEEVGTSEFYNKLLQQIEDAKRTDRRCTETAPAKTNKTTQIGP